jgi:hypothetical protein
MTGISEKQLSCVGFSNIKIRKTLSSFLVVELNFGAASALYQKLELSQVRNRDVEVVPSHRDAECFEVFFFGR